MDTKFQIFVSSTYEDLKEERREIINLILELGHIPVSMEFFPASNDDQWTLIKRLLDVSDYFIVIVGGMYGSENKESGKSYTQLEYEYALDNEIPVIGFIQDDSVLLANKCEKDPLKIEKLNDFKSIVTSKMCRFWKIPQELKSNAAVSLDRLFQDCPRQGWIRAPENNKLNKPLVRPRKLNQITAESFFKSEEDIKKVFNTAQDSFYGFIQYYYLIEGLYCHSNTIAVSDSTLVPIIRNKVSANHPLIDMLWESAYKAIHMFVQLKDILKERSEFAHINDNATILLSYIYYVLCELFGGVPYIPKLITTPEDAMVSRTSVSTIREDSISNLLKVLKSDHKGNMILTDFAKGMLVKWNLQAKKYIQAKIFAEQIINSEGYSLVEPEKIFNTSGEILAGHNALANERSVRYPNFTKYCQKGQFVPYMRYTEILFMTSEIYFNLAEYGQAITYLNMIKERNHHPHFSGDNHLFVKYLLQEWRDDLGMEGSYFSALKRNGYASKVLAIQGWQEILPIPLKELNLNPRIEQNNGY